MMPLPLNLSRIAQVFAVALGSAALTILVDRWQVRTPLNFIWIVGVPILVGAALNTGNVRRIAMVLLLPGASLLVLMITGQLFGSYT